MLGVLGQGHSSLLRASESQGILAIALGTFLPHPLTLLAPHVSLIPRGRKDVGLYLHLKFLESRQDH